MDTIQRIRQKAKSELKKVVLPEYNDSRVKEAAKIIEQEGIAEAVLLTPDKINSQDKEDISRTFIGYGKVRVWIWIWLKRYSRIRSIMLR